LPREDATSLSLNGFEIDRAVLVADVVAAVLRALAGTSENLLAQYRDYCDTIGRAVRITGVGGEQLKGIARDVDELSNLLVEVDGVVHQISVGDVEHLRVTP
jgi:BirA family biotin operon repressor/biotin-[acetyl-CoA-carboxylase] ligase